mgnify:CR=1
MNQLKVLSNENCQVLVDTLLKGNDDFDKKMKSEKEQYEINSAAENGRVNIIDSCIIKESRDNKLNFVQGYKIKKAGRKWKYGEYVCETPFGRFLFIVKSDDALKRAFAKSSDDENLREQEDKKYIDDYLEINKKLIRQSKVPVGGLFEQPIPLFEDEEETIISLIADEEIHEDIDYFFVLVYKTSSERLTSIQLIFPNPVTNDLRLAQDLTEYIQSSQFNSNDNSQQNTSTTSPQENDDDIASFDERITEAEESK